MNIEFVRSGGFAGLRLEISLRTEDLPLPEAARLEELIRLAQPVLPEAGVSERRPDAYQYRLTIGSGEAPPQTWVLHEPGVPGEARPLIDHLCEMAKPGRR